MSLVKAEWLDGVSTSTTTDSEEVTGSSNYGLHVTTTGNFTTLSVQLQGSLDGVNWVSLIAVTGNSMTWVTDKPVRNIRITSTIVVDGSGSVTASVIAD